MRYFFRSRPFDEARRGFYRARNEEIVSTGERERERDRMENGFQQWPRVISNSTSRCNLMLVENKEKKKKGNFFSTLVVRGLAKEGKVISSSCGLSRNALLFHEFFFSSSSFKGEEREREISLPLVEISGATTKMKIAHTRDGATQKSCFSRGTPFV